MSKEPIDRRNFIKSTLAGIGGLLCVASTEKPQEDRIIEIKGARRKFIYRTLGKTGVKLPAISMGAMYAIDPALIRAALDSGLVHLETAHIHMGGKNEAMVGEAIKGRPRDSYLLTTKVALRTNLITGLFVPGETEAEFLKRLDISLKRLGVEYLDFLFLHAAMRRESVLFEPVLKAMEKAKKDGKTRFVGVSTHRNELEVARAAIDAKFYDVLMLPYHHKQQNYLEFRKTIAQAAQAGLGVVAMKVMGGTGAISDILRPVNARAALKWVLQDPNVHTAVPGITTFDEMNIDLSVMEDLTLSDSDKEYLKTASASPGLYCQGCGRCVGQCRAKLPIPDLMRAYMYVHGYRNPSLGLELILSLPLPKHVCESCSLCPVQCSNGWKVAEKIRNVARLRDVPAEWIG